MLFTFSWNAVDKNAFHDKTVWPCAKHVKIIEKRIYKIQIRKITTNPKWKSNIRNPTWKFPKTKTSKMMMIMKMMIIQMCDYIYIYRFPLVGETLPQFLKTKQSRGNVSPTTGTCFPVAGATNPKSSEYQAKFEWFTGYGETFPRIREII